MPNIKFLRQPKEPLQNRLCVYAGASYGTEEQRHEAERLGELIGEGGFDLVYGGFNIGMMGLVAQAAKRHGSEIIGVVPQKGDDPYFKDRSVVSSLSFNDRLEKTGSLDNRKRTMLSMSDGVVALPGGIGSFDEIITTIEAGRGRALRGAVSRFAIVNTAEYYEGLRIQLDQMHQAGLASEPATRMAHFAEDAVDAMEYINAKLAPLRPNENKG